MPIRVVFFFTLALLVLGSCSKSPPSFHVPDRVAGDRTPLTAPCETMDPVRCLLPWPSNTFTAADTSTTTGLRVHVDPASLIASDDVTSVNLADGFSTVTPIVTGFAAAVDSIPVSTDGQGSVRLIVAQHDSPSMGASVPMRFDVQQAQSDSGGNESFVFGYPLRPLEANTDYVGCVLDDLPTTDGTKLAPSRSAQVALGLVAPDTLEEAKLAAYHAPTRAVLQKANIDLHHVLTLWDFTTRDANDPLIRLSAMRKAALDAVSTAKVGVTITNVDASGPAPIAVAVEGQITGLPKFIDPMTGSDFTLDASGLPIANGTRSAPFRVVIPTGTGDYHFVMYGHGTGGDYFDATLDTEIAGNGIAKVGIQYDGWTSEDVIDTFVGIVQAFKGSRHATGMLMQALADATAIQSALGGVLGDALAAPMLGTTPNPAAGRRPKSDIVVWTGGSLGGIMGLVASCADPQVHYGVLNVPGAAWTHFVPKSIIFAMISGFLLGPYQGQLNAAEAVSMTQGLWDEVDGAIWSTQLAGRNSAFLIQESIGDPVVPNPGSEMVAVVTHATQVGAVIVPIAAGIPTANEVDGASAITQYKVVSDQPLDIHGFAALNTPAGNAARAQIASFVASVFAGAPKITVPAGCKGGSCDFSGGGG